MATSPHRSPRTSSKGSLVLGDCASASPACDDKDDARSEASDLERWADRDETLIIFDWDDTLCPTTDGEAADAEALAEQAQAAEEALRAAAAVGHVQIVTMAGRGWVEDTIESYLPNLGAVLDELGIPVRSAREDIPLRVKRAAMADDRDPSQHMKRWTMKRAIREFYRSRSSDRPRSWKNVISIGDSDAERYALQDVVMRHRQTDKNGRWKQCHCKVVKFKERPSVPELSAQLRHITEALDSLVHYDDDYDLFFEDL